MLMATSVNMEADDVVLLEESLEEIDYWRATDVLGEECLETHFPDKHPHIKDDPAITFYEGIFEDEQCIVVSHSRILHIVSRGK